MKKILLFIITVMILLSIPSTAYAKNKDKHNDHHYTCHTTDTKQKFRINGSPVLKYGRYQLPLTPITKGMGATVDYNKDTAVLKVEKGSVKLVIDFKNKTVTVNGVADTNTGIFTAKNSKKMTVLIRYIAALLGSYASIDDGCIIIDHPKLNPPTQVTVISVGSVVLPNTINSTTQYITAFANITAGQAAGGRAELYVGNKLIAVDNSISEYDTSVTFTTSDNAPTNAKLQAIVPSGGVVSVKLYNTANNSAISSVSNPTLIVDYTSPVISGINSALLDKNYQLDLNVIGAGSVGDIVDVTRISIYDTNSGRYYQLTNNAGTGSTGTVKNANLITITLGSADKTGLSGFGSGTMLLTVAPGPFLKDTAGNTSVNFTASQSVPVYSTIFAGLDAPTNVTVTTVGTVILPNTLNTTTLCMVVTANIKAGQATGGRAELYVGNKLIAVDNSISASDTSVIFTTSDNTPVNAELQSLVPLGGTVSVKLYNAGNLLAVSSVSNPTLIVDYSAPTLVSINAAVYNIAGNQIYLSVTGDGAIGDKADVTKLSLYDSYLGKTYTLTDSAVTGSSGIVGSTSLIVINLGTADRAALKGYGTTTVFLTVSSGSLLKDSAGNTSPAAPTSQIISVDMVK